MKILKIILPLRAALIRYAKNHPEALRAALKNAPPSVRAALRRAIAISEARYKEVNRALETRGAGAGEQEPQKVWPEHPRSERTPQNGSSEPTRGEVGAEKGITQAVSGGAVVSRGATRTVPELGGVRTTTG